MKYKEAAGKKNIANRIGRFQAADESYIRTEPIQEPQMRREKIKQRATSQRELRPRNNQEEKECRAKKEKGEK